MGSLDTQIVELNAHLGHLVDAFDKHEASDAKSFKYSHHMLEDILTKKLPDLERSVSFLEKDRQQEIRREDSKEDRQIEIDSRLRIVERLAWVAIGGLIVIAGIISLVGSEIVKALAKVSMP